ncbi:LicD family protein [Candidatus Saccharibacteria bacterium]|nr:LicD family protein [Candidatus Saccharibacteria bacterium]
MKNPINIAKKSYDKILRIDDISRQLNQINSNISLLLQTQESLLNVSNKINQLEQNLSILQTENEYLKELLMANMDIRKAPKAVGNTRLIQLANLKLLLIIKQICKKNRLDFYLNFGSLLGAVRHQGYIPWDDDIDIMMIREDYNQLLKILDKELKGTKLSYVHSEIIRIYYGNTPVQIDIFPSDFYKQPMKDEKERAIIGKKLIDIHNNNIKFDWNKLKTQERVIINLSYPEIEKLRHEQLGPDITKAKAAKIHPAIYHGIEKSSIRPVRSVQDYDWVYPLRNCSFEGETMPIPNQPDSILRQYYHDYMAWPPSFKPKHSDIQSRLNNNTIRILHSIVEGKINMLEK